MNVLASHGQDTGIHYDSPPKCNIQRQDELETIPEEEEPQTEEKQDLANQDTVEFTPDESEEEPSSQPLATLQMTQPLLWANQLLLPLSLMMCASQQKR